MGWAARLNPRSNFNKNKTTEQIKQVETPPQKTGEPAIIELSLTNLWEILCRRLNLTRKKPLQNPAQ